MSDWEKILAMLGNHGRQILYQPLLNQLTGHVFASLLLQQILYRWGQNGRTPFYKFSAPCRHAAYKTGDSWQEEMGFSRTEFETARRRIGAKISRGQKKKMVQAANLVTYWTDNRRLTWYALNEVLLVEKLRSLVEFEKVVEDDNVETLQSPAIVETQQPLCNVENLQYIENAEKLRSKMQEPHNSFIAESSAKKTTERESAPSISFPGSFEKSNGRKPTDKRSHHPAIAGWRNITRRYPVKQNWDLIIQRLGDQPDLERLQRVVTGWLGSGYRPDNVLGILDWYERDQTRPMGFEGGTAVSPTTKLNVNIGLTPVTPLVGGRF